ncbi:MAG: hypothetical protein K8F26_00710, partial [Thiobacillus sp.]|nr:hypothetical protein [Thiobacillus sp.]
GGRLIRAGEARLSMSGQSCQTFLSLIFLPLLPFIMCGREHHRPRYAIRCMFERRSDFFGPT